jgi:hypothetical protein
MVAQHQEMTNRFQEQVRLNQVRFQQIQGAISELQLFLVEEDKPPGKDSQGPDRKIKKEALIPTRT